MLTVPIAMAVRSVQSGMQVYGIEAKTCEQGAQCEGPGSKSSPGNERGWGHCKRCTSSVVQKTDKRTLGLQDVKAETTKRANRHYPCLGARP